MIHQSVIVSGPMFILVADAIWITILAVLLVDRTIRLRAVFWCILFAGLCDVIRELSVLLTEFDQASLTASHNLRVIVGLGCVCSAVTSVFHLNDAKAILRQPKILPVTEEDREFAENARTSTAYLVYATETSRRKVDEELAQLRS